MIKPCKKCGSTNRGNISKGHPYGRCLDCQKSYAAKCQMENPEKIRAKGAKWRAANPEKIRAKDAKRRAENPEKERARGAKWRAANPDYQAKWQAKRRRTDLQYKLAHNLRKRLTKAIRNNYKAGSAVRDIGCSIVELGQHLEKQLKPGMTWANWSPDGWHIDHIKALSKFDLTDREQFLKACHYTNLQPLWAKDNLAKGNR